MGKISLGRVLLGGIAAGAVAGVLGFLLDGVMLGPQWVAGLTALGKADLSRSPWTMNFPLQLGEGILSVWVYAAIRKHYGAGPRTAIRAGLAVWVGAALAYSAFMFVMSLFPPKLAVITILGGIFELGAGALAGAALYQKIERA